MVRKQRYQMMLQRNPHSIKLLSNTGIALKSNFHSEVKPKQGREGGPQSLHLESRPTALSLASPLRQQREPVISQTPGGGSVGYPGDYGEKSIPEGLLNNMAVLKRPNLYKKAQR